VLGANVAWLQFGTESNNIECNPDIPDAISAFDGNLNAF